MIMQIPGFSCDTAGKPQIALDDESLYAFGHLIRSTEQLILDLFGRGLLSGTTHTCLGQELCQIAVVRALDDPDDAVLSNHRNHGHLLTYTGDFAGLVAETMGRQSGICGGYGGSQHMAFRHFHSNGVQAGMTAIAAGLGLSRKRAGSKSLVAAIIGDGTLGEGLLYESMNLSSIWGARVLYVVENNGIAQTTYSRDTVSGDIEDRGRAFGIATWRLDDSQPGFAANVADIVGRVRRSDRPGLLVIDTGRLGPHSKGDDLRAESERDALTARDPLRALAARLPAARKDTIDRRNEAFMQQVEKEALDSPEARFQGAPRSILRSAVEAPAPAMPRTATNVRGSINNALRALLEANARVVLLGEDLHEPYGGAFKVTAGLSSAFPDRVISTPISEAGIVGASIGLALNGARPIVEIMFADFLTLCMDQLYNHAVKFPGMFPDVNIPIVVRTPCGGRRGYGPTHSQSPENIFVSVPGLTVIYGSHRHNVGQLLVDAVQRWPNPVLFLEHKLLYGEVQDPAAYEAIEADSADAGAHLFPTLRSGSTSPDLTLLAFGGMLPIVERAADHLRKEEDLEVEVVAPSLLAPLPRASLLKVLMNRPRILVVEESHHEFGFSAELLATLAESRYRGTVSRIGTAPVPIASARSLERDQIADERTIVLRALAML